MCKHLSRFISSSPVAFDKLTCRLCFFAAVIECIIVSCKPLCNKYHDENSGNSIDRPVNVLSNASSYANTLVSYYFTYMSSKANNTFITHITIFSMFPLPR